MTKVIVDFQPDDQKWKRTVAGCADRLRLCEKRMEETRGTRMNMGWLYWSGEWGEAFEWLQKRAPRICRAMFPPCDESSL